MDSSREYIWRQNVLDLNKPRLETEQIDLKQIKCESPEYSMPPPIDQVNDVLKENRFNSFKSDTIQNPINPLKSDSHEYNMPTPNALSNNNGQLSKNMPPVIKTVTTKRVSAKTYRPAIRRIVKVFK